eukprot:Rmarinus@m.9035
MRDSLLLVWIFLALNFSCASTNDCGGYSCHPNALCTVESTGSAWICQCGKGFYGDGLDCLPCGEKMTSASGSLHSSNCTCIEGYVQHEGVDGCSEECTFMEVLRYASSAVDMGLISTVGCDLEHFGDNEFCCERVFQLFTHKCMLPAVNLINTGSSPHLYFVRGAERRCRGKLGIGLLERTGCGNGILEPSLEYCDDNNTLSDDGCSARCFVEPGYSCDTREGRPSTCLQCRTDCDSEHRLMCEETNGLCGACIEGYRETGGGICGKVLRVLYVPLDHPWVVDEEVEHNGVCNVTDLGEIVEASRYPSARPYIDHVNKHFPKEERLSIPYGSCSLNSLANLGPAGPGVVVVAEAIFGHVVTTDPNIGALWESQGSESFFVIFSDDPTPAVMGVADITSQERSRLVDVYDQCTVVFYNIRFAFSRSFEGGFIRTYGGRAIIESSVLERAETRQFTEEEVMTSTFEWFCDGYAIMVAGALVLRDVTVQNMAINAVNVSSNCLAYRSSTITSYGNLQVYNTTFKENTVFGQLIHVGGRPEVSLLENVIVEGNTVGDTLFLSDLLVTMKGVGFRQNRHSGLLLTVHGESIFSDFFVEDNESVEGLPTIAQLGGATWIRGVFRGNMVSTETAVVVNRASLHLEHVAFIDSGGMAIQSTSNLYCMNCTFGGNQGSALCRTISNTGTLEIVGSTFLDGPLPRSQVEIESSELFIVRNSIVPYVTGFADCSDTLPTSYSPRTKVCAATAECSEPEVGRILCQCPIGQLGNPVDLCGYLAVLYLLPSDYFYLARTKEEGVPSSPTSVRILADGFGAVTWHIISELPDWLKITPTSGLFVSNGVCADEPVDALIEVDIASVTADNNARFDVVEIMYNSSYYDPYENMYWSNSDRRNLTIELVVEVIPSHIKSKLRSEDPICHAGELCDVTVGAPVSLRVSLRDSADLVVDDQHSSPFDVELSPIADINTISLGPGEVLLNLLVPENPFFNVSVRVAQGKHIQGSPLRFEVSCHSGDEWDWDTNECYTPMFRIQKEIGAICLVVSFVITAVSVEYFRGKQQTSTFDMLQSESVRAVFSLFIDLIDFATDVSACYYVVIDVDLQAYAPYYLSAAAVSFVVWLVVSALKVRMLRTIVKEDRVASGDVADVALREPMFVVGVSGVESVKYRSEVRSILRRLRRQRIFHALGFMGMLCEDLPMQVLNVIILVVSQTKKICGSPQPGGDVRSDRDEAHQSILCPRDTKENESHSDSIKRTWMPHVTSIASCIGW